MAMGPNVTMDQARKTALLDWLERYRAATGAARDQLGVQVEAHTVTLNGMLEEAWFSVLCANMETTTPIVMVGLQADLAYAETQALLFASA